MGNDLRWTPATLGKRTHTLPLWRLLGRESHRHLHACPHGEVSNVGECGLPCGLRGALCTLHLVRSALGRTPGMYDPVHGARALSRDILGSHCVSLSHP